jgi:four helix bundle protein
MENKQIKFDLEDRLVDFAGLCLEVCEILPPSKAGQTLECRLSKSSTASALIYGEAQAAESRADFLHKMKSVLKEIRETRLNLKIIKRKLVGEHEKVETAFNESIKLMAIFLKSIDTVKKNEKSELRNKK